MEIDVWPLKVSKRNRPKNDTPPPPIEESAEENVEDGDQQEGRKRGKK